LLVYNQAKRALQILQRQVAISIISNLHDFLDKLDGMFVFALYDIRQQKIILARDRLVRIFREFFVST